MLDRLGALPSRLRGYGDRAASEAYVVNLNLVLDGALLVLNVAGVGALVYHRAHVDVVALVGDTHSWRNAAALDVLLGELLLKLSPIAGAAATSTTATIAANNINFLILFSLPPFKELSTNCKKT